MVHPIRSELDRVRYAVKVRHYFASMPAREDYLKDETGRLEIHDSPIVAVNRMERFDRSRYELGAGETRRPDCYVVPIKL